MSKETAQLPIILWSASQVTLYDPQTRQSHAGSSIAEVANFVNSKSVIVVFSRRSSFVRVMRVPDAPKEQVAQILALQLPGQVPLQFSDIAFDFHLSKSSSAEGKLAVVTAVSVASLAQIHKELKSLGLQAKQVAVVSLGSSLLAQSLDLGDCAIVENTFEGLAIDVIADGDLRYTRVVPFPKSSEAIEAEVCRTFTVAKVPCSHIVASGGLSFGGADTTVATRPLDVFGTGLITRLDINIELPEKVAERQKKALYTKGRTAVMVWIGAIILALVLLQIRSDMAQQVESENSRYYATQSQLTKALKDTKAKVATSAALVTALQAAFQPAQLPSDVIADVSSKVIPEKMWVGGVVFERGKLLMIRGTALDSDTAAAYEQDLSIDPRFRDVKLVFANNGTLENTPVVEFSISAHVMGNLPLVSEGQH